MRKPLRIGTRRSRLAVWQADYIKARLEKEAQIPCSLVRIVTEGDRMLDAPLAVFGGKGLFVNEIERALLKGDIDLAVHSMKDLPAEIPAGLMLAAIPEREDPRDALLCRKTGLRLSQLKTGACIGTSSLRRASQLRFYRQDFNTEAVRGNVETRIRKLDEGKFDAIVLALAGLKRLKLLDRVDEVLDPRICLPAIGQGALAIEIRETDTKLFHTLQALHDPLTAFAVNGERAFLSAVEGGCQVPIGCYGRVEKEQLDLTGLIANLDGSVCIRKNIAGNPEGAERLGNLLAEEILEAGGRQILEELKAATLEEPGNT